MSSKTCRFLSANVVQRVYSSLIANAKPTQPNLLESAVASPMNRKYYEGQENLYQLAASLSEKIIKNHAFQDGNKRTALAATDMFFKTNGWRLRQTPFANDPHDIGLENAHVKVVTNQWTAEQLGEYYETGQRQNLTAKVLKIREIAE
ncbi:MAG: hypothetical protein M1815_005023 [Lichina confinis]|nr:MAG: hypothetical protein M1815_005023 [Lichina confinis]